MTEWSHCLQSLRDTAASDRAGADFLTVIADTDTHIGGTGMPYVAGDLVESYEWALRLYKHVDTDMVFAQDLPRVGSCRCTVALSPLMRATMLVRRPGWVFAVVEIVLPRHDCIHSIFEKVTASLCVADTAYCSGR